MSTHNPPSGRFDQSFMFHMIRDFFLLALVVAGVELGIRYAMVRYDFSNHEPERVDRAAQQLANDVKSIMLNSGGPTAAQTVYPILTRNYDGVGLSIAVEPAPVTIESMKLTRSMDARGLPAAWPQGPHRAASVQLRPSSSASVATSRRRSAMCWARSACAAISTARSRLGGTRCG